MNALTKHEEKQLITFCNKGNGVAFHEAIILYGERALPFLCSVAGQYRLAKDALMSMESDALNQAVENELRAFLKKLNLPRALFMNGKRYQKLLFLTRLLERRAPERLNALLEEFKRKRFSTAAIGARWLQKRLPKNLPAGENSEPVSHSFRAWRKRLRRIDLVVNLNVMIGLIFVFYFVLPPFESPLPHASWGKALFLFICVWAGFIVPKLRKPTAKMLQSVQKSQDIPALALMESRSSEAREALIERLTHLDLAHPPSFNAQELSQLHSLIDNHNSFLLMPLFQLLSVSGNEQSLEEMKIWLNANKSPSFLRDAAQKAATHLQTRLTQTQDRRVLLRAGEGEHVPEELLRAARSSEEMPAEQLLRSQEDSR